MSYFTIDTGTGEMAHGKPELLSIEKARRTDQPDPSWIVDDCPSCGGPVVCNSYYIGGRGYVIRQECWYSLTSPEFPVASCDYRHTL